MFKAEKQVKKAEDLVKKAQEKELERAQIAADVQKRADLEAEMRKHGSFVARQTITIATTSRKSSEAHTNKRKHAPKLSKEVRATKAKEKTMAKKERRAEPTAEGSWHESCSSDWAVS